MFGFLKNLLRKPVEEPAENHRTAPSDQGFETEEEAPPKPQPVRAAASRQARATAGGHPTQVARPAARGPSAPQTQAQHGKVVQLPLQPILDSLPLELQPRVMEPQVGDLTVSIPLEKVLSQLSRGSVKIAFGELRQATSGVFSNETDRDRVAVPLPLNEILTRLNPALISRRRVQKQIEVPSDISSPFDPNSQSQIFNVGPSKPEATQPPATFAQKNSGPQKPITPQRVTTPVQKPGAPAAPSRGSMTSAPTPQPPSAGAGAPPSNIPFAQRPAADLRPASPKPVAPISPIAPAGAEDRFEDIPGPIKMSPVKPPAPAPQPPVSAAVPPQGQFSMRAPTSPPSPAAQPTPPRPVGSPAAGFTPSAPKNGSDQEVLLVPLTAVAEAWPEPVRKEVVQLGLVDSKLALPVEMVGQALKQGRIAFPWKNLRAWVKGAGALPVSSPNDGIIVELALKVVAPLFLARQKEAKDQQQRVSIDSEIPNLFFGFPQGDNNNASVTKPDTNYYVWDDQSDTAHLTTQEAKKPSIETRFVSRCATPNEVVSRAAALDGVAGALIALPDGLMVASRISPDLNGETLAAFLPQIFSKVTQCTKELRMGELNNLHFTVGNVPWKIFRVNAIFFAVFGRAGEGLPTAQLTALAAELDHKPK